MADEYTPTTEQVRTHWTDVGFAGDGESFDRWLAAHDRETAARAWDEGYQASTDAELGHIAPAGATNPYREGDPT